MSMTDPISDMLTRIRNATTVRHDRTDVPASKMKLEIAKILKQEGFIRTFKQLEEGPQGLIRIYLKYAEDGESVIHGLRRVSTPGRRVYRAADDLPKVQNGLGVAVVSTNRGVLTDEQARGLGVGGEVLCFDFGGVR
jgi:small subunit ribosomal protein S8